jgi:Cu/Ag efflux pump CusA
MLRSLIAVSLRFRMLLVGAAAGLIAFGIISLPKMHADVLPELSQGPVLKGVPFGRELVIRGAGERLSPILMTALATALALAPLVIFGQRPGQEIENPMAIVILGGLATSSVTNLFVLPALYLRFAHGRTPQGPMPDDRGTEGDDPIEPNPDGSGTEPRPVPLPA